MNQPNSINVLFPNHPNRDNLRSMLRQAIANKRSLPRFFRDEMFRRFAIEFQRDPESWIPAITAAYSKAIELGDEVASVELYAIESDFIKLKARAAARRAVRRKTRAQLAKPNLGATPQRVTKIWPHRRDYLLIAWLFLGLSLAIVFASLR